MSKRTPGPAFIGMFAAGLAAAASVSLAQAPPASPSPPPPPRYPTRTVDPAAVERGRALYTANSCSFCHGADIRGGDGGPSLQRSSIVLTDQKGEAIGKIVKNGVPGTAMPAFKLSDAQIADIADFLHSFKVSNGGELGAPSKSILVGSADAGRAYFQKTCAACHSASGDLAHLAAKYPDQIDLQQAWLGPSAKTPMSVTITQPGGSKLTGRPTQIDEFSVKLVQADGTTRTVERNGPVPKVELHDPLQPHSDLLSRYTDKDIHDVTAYLVTLK